MNIHCFDWTNPVHHDEEMAEASKALRFAAQTHAAKSGSQELPAKRA